MLVSGNLRSRFLDNYPPGNEKTYPTKREVGKIIDSKVPTGRGYVSSLEGTII